MPIADPNNDIHSVSFVNNSNTNINNTNATLKTKIDSILGELKTQNDAINALQSSMTEIAITTRRTINSENDIRGKNIFLAQPIDVGNILDFLAPLGIQEKGNENSTFFVPIPKPLTKTVIETSIYNIASPSTRATSSEQVYISIPVRLPLSILTGADNTISPETNIELLASSNTISKNTFIINNFNLYQLTGDEWSIGSNNNNINYIGIGNNGMIYMGALNENDIHNAVKYAKDTNDPNTLEYLIDKYINNGALPVNQLLIDRLTQNKANYTTLLTSYETSIQSIQSLIQEFRNSSTVAATQQVRAETLITTAKANIAAEQTKFTTDIITTKNSIASSTYFTSFFSRIENYFTDINNIQQDVLSIDSNEANEQVYTTNAETDAALIASDNTVIQYLQTELIQLQISKNGVQTTINEIVNNISIAENPQDIMKIQNYNTANAPPNENSSASHAFNSGYSRPISYLGCYRDSIVRSIKTNRGNYDYQECANKAIENGDNIFGLQWGASTGPNPQCFTDLQTGPDYAAKTKNPGTTTEILHPTLTSFVRPKEYTCVSDSTTPNIKYGGSWTNATYLVQNGYNVTIQLIGFEDQTSEYPAGSLILNMKDALSLTQSSGFPKVIKRAPSNSFIKKSNLSIFPLNKRGPSPMVLMNSSNSLTNFIGIEGNIQLSLYSSDFYFKFTLSGTAPPSIQININTDSDVGATSADVGATSADVGATSADIASRRTQFKLIQDFISEYKYMNVSRNLNSIYFLDLNVNNTSLGDLGFVSYNNNSNSNLESNSDTIGTASNPYVISFYNNGSSDISQPSLAQDSQFEFLKLKGSLTGVSSNITAPDNILDINACKQYCYSNVKNCTAWQYNELETKYGNNKCLISSETSLNEILTSAAWSAAKGADTNFNIKMPSDEIVPSGCPPFNKANVVVTRVPIIVETASVNRQMYTTSAINLGTGENFYYVKDTNEGNPVCNVDKALGGDSSRLESLKTIRNTLIEQKLNPILNKLNSAEQKIYTGLLENQNELNNNIGQFGTLKHNLDYLNNESDINITMNAAVDDSMLQLIDNSYEYMLWTILAIVIVIIAINLANK